MLESSWLRLLSKLGEAADLDMVIAAHDAYLSEIMQKALLAGDEASQSIMAQLSAVLDTILRYCR